MKKENSILYIVVPCYNEEEVLPLTSKIFLDELNDLIDKQKISKDSRILFVNDGSKDDTWKIIEGLSKEDEHYVGISLSRNRGHQNALLAGLMDARQIADITISIDCDGQDDVTAMEAMVDEYHSGAEIVYGVRKKRETDTFFKRFTAQSFYRILNSMGVEAVYNHADYRLVSAKVLKELEKYKEVNLYLRGLFPLVGFKSTCVYYDRNERIAGKSHYPIGKMLGLAVDGITSLSIKPIRIITMIGLLMALISFVGVIWAIVRKETGHTVVGWASMATILCLVSGIQMTSIGVIGEYVGKIYLETKQRPRYIISDRTDVEQTKQE